MKIVFLVFDIGRGGGTERSVITLANYLGQQHDVEILSVLKAVGHPLFEISPRVRVRHLVSTESPGARLLENHDVSDRYAARLHEMPSVVVPGHWASGFTGLTDFAIESALREVSAEVVVTTTSALLSLAVQFLPPRVSVVHHEHRASTRQHDGLEPLLAFAARADLAVVPTETMAKWLTGQLGLTGPRVEAVPHPLPQGFIPRSRLQAPLIMSAGRLTPDKQFGQLIRAFGLISDRLPGWRLRIFGDGPRRHYLEALTKELKLYDRVELPGSTSDLSSEWAKASIAAVTSRAGSILMAQEAVAAGVPVVGYDTPGGLQEVIQHGRNGLLVPADSIMALRSSLLRLVQDQELRQRLGDGVAESVQRFAPAVVAERWEKLLREVAQRPRGAAGRSRVLRSASHALIGQERMSPAETASEPRDDVSGGVAARAMTATVTPKDARRLALAWAVETAERARVSWFVIPPVRGSRPVLVLPDTARDHFLDLISREGVPALLGIHAEGGVGWEDLDGSVAEMALFLREKNAPHLRLQAGIPSVEKDRANLYTHGCGIDIEFWHVDEGDLYAPRRNGYVQRVRQDEPTVRAEVEGVDVRTLPLMAGRTVYDPGLTVDAVYTWVDGSDPAWLERRDRRRRAMSNGREDERASGVGRYLSRDELRYSLRSVFLFAPWIRHIYLVTDRQRPDWLDPDHPDITVVDHRDILDEAYLPTFNSHAIETGIHRIPGLSEHFIYFNDDVFLGRPVAQDMFFSPSGQPAMFPAPGTLGLKQSDAPPWLHAAYNNRDLLERDFGRTITNAMLHTPHPMRRSVIEELENRYPGEFKRTAAAPFRSETDLSVMSSLTQHYALLNGHGYLGELSAGYISLAVADLGAQLRQLLTQRCHDVFCLADYHEHALAARRVEQLTHEFLVDYFPISAPWELGTAD
jgi:glycosyltransferase involved in cell wall biosynthesis